MEKSCTNREPENVVFPLKDTSAFVELAIENAKLTLQHRLFAKWKVKVIHQKQNEKDEKTDGSVIIPRSIISDDWYLSVDELKSKTVKKIEILKKLNILYFWQKEECFCIHILPSKIILRKIPFYSSWFTCKEIK